MLEKYILVLKFKKPNAYIFNSSDYMHSCVLFLYSEPLQIAPEPQHLIEPLPRSSLRYLHS